jgi:hypothetical protein
MAIEHQLDKLRPIGGRGVFVGKLFHCVCVRLMVLFNDDVGRKLIELVKDFRNILFLSLLVSA